MSTTRDLAWSPRARLGRAEVEHAAAVAGCACVLCGALVRDACVVQHARIGGRERPSDGAWKKLLLRRRRDRQRAYIAGIAVAVAAMAVLCLCALLPHLAAALPTHQLPGAARPTLEELIGKSGSDKAFPSNGNKNAHHGYARYYEPFMEPLRDDPIRLLEIGVEQGRSLRVWQEYFESAGHVFGIGYGNFQELAKQDCGSADSTRVADSALGRCTIYRGDQSNAQFLENFAVDSGGAFDVLIDDGSHVPSHQRISFTHLWPHVKPGGYYILEDIETSYWSRGAQVYGYTLVGEHSVIGHFQKVIDTINREMLGTTAPGLPELYYDISSIQFGLNIIILRKMSDKEKNVFYKRKYRFANRLKGQRLQQE